MDPITAFSLACGVIQVIDFSTKVLSHCREIYKNGSLSENESIESMAEHLTTLCADLQPTTSSIGAQTAGDKDLIQLSNKCSEMAKELVGELQSIKAGSTGSRWKAVSSTYRSLKKKGTIDRMQRRLDEYRKILDTKVLADLRQRSIQNSLLQTKGFCELDKKIQSLGDSLTDSRQTFDELKEVLRKHSESTSAHFDSRFQQHEETLAKTGYNKAFLESLWYPDIQAREEGIKDAHAKTFEWLLDDSKTVFQPWDNFVAWLEGGQGTYWISGKAGSGKSTLMRYICDNDRTTNLLRAWAGSREILVVKFFFWRAGSSAQKTIIGLLRSLLYQIFSALPELIGIISADNVSPASRHGRHGALPAWTEARLKKYSKALLLELAKSHRACFFLDGLDELDQRYEQIVSMVRDLTENTDLKTCLSSRPYRIFSDAFSSSAMLRLHDLTEADIRKYVTESLLPTVSMPRFEDSGAKLNIPETIVRRADGVFLWAELVVREVNRGITNEDSQQQLKHRIDSLPDEIEQLYGYMLGCIDTVYKIEAARCFAVQMDSIFDNGSSLLELSLVIHEGHKDDHPLAFADLSAAQTLGLCNSTARRLPTTCAGLLEIQEDRDPVDHMSLSDLARLVLPSQFAVPDIDLNKIPQELLELLRIRLHVRVQFVHRTALDFLRENSVGIKFIKDHDRYAVHECVSRLDSMVAVWRLLGCGDPNPITLSALQEGRLFEEGSMPKARLSPWLYDIRNLSIGAMDQLLFQAVLTESIMGTAQLVLWNYVERATEIAKSSYLTNLKGGPYVQIPQDSYMIEPASREDQWAKNTGDVASMMVSNMPEDFLGFAAFYGLSLYVQYRLHSDPGLQCTSKATYLLACFVSNVVWVLHKNLDLPSNAAHRPVEFVRYLLDRGADPNAATASSTIWGDFLEHLYTAYLGGRMYEGSFYKEEWALMTMAFLDKDANTAQNWNLRSGALWTVNLRLMDLGSGEWGKESPDFENCLPPDFKHCLFGFNGSFSTFTILHKCLRDCDEWVAISNELIAPHKRHFSKCTRFYFSDPGFERWTAFVGYTLSDQQSEDFLQVYDPCADELEVPGSFDKTKLLEHVLRLRRELEEGASGAGTKVVELAGH